MAIATLLAGPPCLGGDRSVRDVVSAFYTTYIERHPSGLPDGEDLRRLAPFLSTRLNKQIIAALNVQRDFMRKLPDAKPPYVDGCYFATVFEGPEEFAIVKAVKKSNERWEVEVSFLSEGFSWKDTVVVVAEKGRYLIDDVYYSGAGPFNPPGKLSEALRSK